MDAPPARVHGLVLAAGAGTRMGRPKAGIVAADGEPWVARAVRVLREGGCDGVSVVLGAGAEDARAHLDDGRSGVDIVVAEDWAEGLSASLRTGLAHLIDAPVQAEVALVHLVDLPDVGADVVRRLLAAVRAADVPAPAVLARAVYDARPGHPVVLGRQHWAPICREALGDRGARAYLASHPTRGIECGDIAHGRDVDRPAQRGV